MYMLLSIENPKCGIPIDLDLPGLVLYWLVEKPSAAPDSPVSHFICGGRCQVSTDSSNKPPNIHRAVV